MRKRYTWVFLIFAMLSVLLATPAKADPTSYTYTFLSCNFVSGCPDPTVIASFETASPVAGPALPSPLPTPYYSDSIIVPTLKTLAGSFTHVYVQSYNNIYNDFGAVMIIDGLVAANGIGYGQTVGFGAFVDGPTTDPLIYLPGLYTGLIAYACNYGPACPSDNGAEDSVHLLVTEAPEPGDIALLLAPMVGLAAIRSRRRFGRGAPGL